MSTTVLTGPKEGEVATSGAGAGSKAAAAAGRRRPPRCCISRRIGALLVGSFSLAILVASITATVYGIVSEPDTARAPGRPRTRTPTLTGANFRSTTEPRKRSPGAAADSIGGILATGGLRDPASGGGGGTATGKGKGKDKKKPMELPEGEVTTIESEDGPALIVVAPRGRGGGGTGGRLVGGAGGGQLFFNPAEDNRPVYIIRPAANGEPGSVIVTSPGDLVPVEEVTQTDESIIVDLEFKKPGADGTGNSGQLINTNIDADADNSTSNSTVTTTRRPSFIEPPPLTEHLWLRAERGPLAVALALQIVFFILTALMVHGVRKRREDLVLLWLVSSAFGLAVGSAGAVLSALSAFDVGTPGAMLVGFAYLVGLALFWCGWAVVVAYHRQATPPEFDRSHPHFG